MKQIEPEFQKILNEATFANMKDKPSKNRFSETTQTIPTFEEFVIEKFGKIPEDSFDMIDLAHEYAVLFAKWHREQFQYKVMTEIKDYLKYINSPENIIYQENELLIMSCFAKTMEFIENASNEENIK